MQNIIDTRVLKKFGLYIGVWTSCVATGFAVLLGGMWLSVHYFDSPAPFVIGLFTIGLISSVFMMAKERVEYERRMEQNEIDLIAARLKADEERQKWNEEFYQRFGSYPNTTV